MTFRAGVIDVGTNSVRVLVADVTGGVVADVERDLIITRLGEGVDRTRRLGAEPMRRTVDAIARYAERCRAREAEAIRVIATSAARDAENGDEFMSMVRAAAGVAVDVLPGDEEARLGFAGATADLRAPSPFLIVDIGGGSTELVWGSKTAERFISLDIGAVRLTERHVRNDPPSVEDLVAVRADADEHVAHAAHAIGEEPPGTLVGLAGTITTLAAIDLGLAGYDRGAIHHARLARDRIGAIRGRLALMTSAERRALPAMPPGREDVIVAGTVILEAVMDRFGCGDCLVSESDILDGAALDLATSDISPETRASQ